VTEKRREFVFMGHASSVSDALKKVIISMNIQEMENSWASVLVLFKNPLVDFINQEISAERERSIT
jgi:hypothetical protein